MNFPSVAVSVVAACDFIGRITPLQVAFDSGEVFDIDDVYEEISNTEASPRNDAWYNCMIEGRRVHLMCQEREKGQWYLVE